MWFLDLSLYRLDLTPIYPLHPETIGIIGLGAVLFSMGGGLAMLAPRNLLQAQMIITRFPPRNNIVKPAVTFFLFCGLPLLLSNLLAMAAQGTGSTISSELAPAARRRDNSQGQVRWELISSYGRYTRLRCSCLSSTTGSSGSWQA